MHNSFANWNPQMLCQTQLLNAQTGALEPARIVDLGNETIAVRGAPLAAKRYRITGTKNRLISGIPRATSGWRSNRRWPAGVACVMR